MLSREDNQILTQTSAGTPMGNLLRRYWMPIAAETEFDHAPIKGVRLLGEDLTLYKDLSGTYGLVDRHCPHRRADTSYGFVEACGLRCNYHGWLFDRDGRCLEQPYEDTAAPQARFRDRVSIKSYPVRLHAGLLWAYLGPAPAPLVPNWEPFTWKNGFVQIVFANIPCNWFQCQENSCDPVHFEWMHMNWSLRLRGAAGPYSPKHLKVAFGEFDHGLVYRRVREGMDESDPLWTIGRCALWPNALFTGNHFEWRVPVDDENTLSVMWCFSRVPTEREPYLQGRIPHWHGPIQDAHGRWISSHIMNQDFIAWVGQGTTADRTQEHLGSSDRGILMMRKRFLSDLEAIERGEDPKATIRDAALNASGIPLPVADRKILTEGLPLEELKKHPLYGPHIIKGYPFQLGQPDGVKRAFEEAMGLP